MKTMVCALHVEVGTARGGGILEANTIVDEDS